MVPSKDHYRHNEARRLMTAATARVTVKGQITIPESIRRLLSIREGDEIMFIPNGKRVSIERLPAQVPSASVFGRLRRPGAEPLDIQEERNRIRSLRARRYDEEGKDGAE